MDKNYEPRYYRIEVVVRAEVPEDTDALAAYVERRLSEALLTPTAPADVWEVYRG